MRLVVIAASNNGYTVYEGAQMKAIYRAAELLDAFEVEDLRQNPPYLARENPAQINQDPS